MIIVIQCAASKQSGSGHLMSSGGKRIVFVADPKAAPAVASASVATCSM